jgi:hypothetical protein
MGYEENSGFCPSCDRKVLARRPEVNHVLHAFLLIVTAGLWAPFWLLSVHHRKPWRCAHCGQALESGRKASPAAILAALTIVLSFALLTISALAASAPKREAAKPAPAPPSATISHSEALPVITGSWTPKEQLVEQETPPSETTGPKISLRDPRISIQTAVVRICQSAGLQYDWRRSFESASPNCRRYISVDLAETPLQDALNEVVLKNGLHYRIQDGKIWLEL